VLHRNRKQRARRIHHGRVQEALQHIRLDRRRQNHDAQILARFGLNLAHQTERQVAIQMALMKLVKHDAADAF
jgi:hypothetical protein